MKVFCAARLMSCITLSYADARVLQRFSGFVCSFVNQQLLLLLLLLLFCYFYFYCTEIKCFDGIVYSYHATPQHFPRLQDLMYFSMLSLDCSLSTCPSLVCNSFHCSPLWSPHIPFKWLRYMGVVQMYTFCPSKAISITGNTCEK